MANEKKTVEELQETLERYTIAPESGDFRLLSSALTELDELRKENDTLKANLNAACNKLDNMQDTNRELSANLDKAVGLLKEVPQGDYWEVNMRDKVNNFLSTLKSEDKNGQE